MQMPPSSLNGEKTGRAAHVTKRLKRTEVELAREGLEIDSRKAGHRAHELLEPGQFGVKLLEHSLLAVLDFILRFSSAERLGQIVPVLEQTSVEHLQNAADIARAVPVQIKGALGRVRVFGFGTVPLPVQKLQRDKRVKKVTRAARMQAEFRAQYRGAQRMTGEPGKQSEFD